ncbi:Histamine H4 receptor [Tupaia chinensis]|uniref:Histamine H4 receptor n=1 Tax=Tupaia chinensis TaxID=246437 RepID=L8YD15_TUPCH|nr:Histamine H4 receptor [Tupaia chinensis]
MVAPGPCSEDPVQGRDAGELQPFHLRVISIPLYIPQVLFDWKLKNEICAFWLITDYLLCTASVYNIVLISYDRYQSVLNADDLESRRSCPSALSSRLRNAAAARRQYPSTRLIHVRGAGARGMQSPGLSGVGHHLAWTQQADRPACALPCSDTA